MRIMAECRYYRNCALMCPCSAATCDGAGHVLIAGTDFYDCDTYEPIPDVKSLMALAEYLGSIGDDMCHGCVVEGRCLGVKCSVGAAHEIACRIRAAIGDITVDAKSS